jgi:response regulator of citrate/malate metabolism
MTPSEYVSSRGISQKQFGQLFNPPVSQGLVSQWFRGVTKMTLEQALQAVSFSDNQITAEECASLFRYPEPNVSAAVHQPTEQEGEVGHV